jgi:hypothetical protein
MRAHSCVRTQRWNKSNASLIQVATIKPRATPPIVAKT